MFGLQSGGDTKTCAVHVPFTCEVSGMERPDPDLVAADLARLVTPGLRSPRVDLVVLPNLAVVGREFADGAHSLTDAIEKVVNRGLLDMAAHAQDGSANRFADPVKALRAALALRPGSERVKSKTRRLAAAEALGLLSADGWRAHHEKALLLELARVICALEAQLLDEERGVPHIADTGSDISESGITKFYRDFVDIESDWERLFGGSPTLDLVMMYGATWRNTYRKHLHALAGRPDGRIRVILPDPSADSLLMGLYAHTLGITDEDFRGRVHEAVADFRSIQPRRHVEIYLTTVAFRHAIYMFPNRAVLALYALCSERIPTPAFLVSEGGLLSFMRVDFDRLLEQSDRVS
ncbi:MAG: hypothetical protein ACRDZ4_24305 [Egibacteraceae bacterium]